MSYKVFISYSSADLPVVDAIDHALVNPDVQVFVAEWSLIAGEDISIRIQEEIQNCDLFVLLWSRNSKASDWVRQELGIALGKSKKIFPIVLHAGLDLPPFIRDIKYFAAYNNPEYLIPWLRETVFYEANKKSENERNTGLIAIAAIIALIAAANSQE